MSKTLKLGIVIGASLGPGMGRVFRTAEERAGKLGKTLSKVRLAKTAAGDVIKYKTVLGRLKAKQVELGVSTQAQARRIAETEKRYLAAKAAARRYGIRIGDVVRQHKHLAHSAKLAERQVAGLEKRQLNKARRGELRGQAMGALGAAYALSRPFKQAMDVEQSEIRLRTVINTKNVESELGKARRYAKDYASKKLGSETEVLDVQYALNSAGLTSEAARLGSDVVLKVGKITGGVSEQVGEVMATSFKNLGDSLKGNVQERLTRIGELLTKTQFKFQIRDFGQLGESLKKGSVAIARYNIDLGQGVTLLGALNAAGLQGSLAGTALSASMRNMSKASREFGFDLQKTKDGQLDVIATMEALSDAIGGFENIDQDINDDLQRVFGDEGMQGITVFGKKLKGLRAAQKEVEDSRGIIDTNYTYFLKSSSGQVQILGQNVTLLGTAITSTLLPSLNSIVGPLAKGANWLGRVAEEHPLLTKAIGGTVVGLVGLKLASVGAAYAGTILSDGWSIAGNMLYKFKPALFKTTLELYKLSATAALTAAKTKALAIGGSIKSFGGTLMSLAGKAIPMVVGAFQTMGTVIMAHPVIAAVAGIALAAGLIYANWDKVGPYFKKAWRNIKAIFKSPIEWISKKLSFLGDAWRKVTTFGTKVAKPIGKLAGATALGATIATTALPKKTAAASISPAIEKTVADGGGGSAGTINIKNTYGDIVIHATSGMDAKQIAEEVRRVLDERDRNAAARTRAQLYDD